MKVPQGGTHHKDGADSPRLLQKYQDSTGELPKCVFVIGSVNPEVGEARSRLPCLHCDNISRRSRAETVNGKEPGAGARLDMTRFVLLSVFIGFTTCLQRLRRRSRLRSVCALCMIPTTRCGRSLRRVCTACAFKPHRASSCSVSLGRSRHVIGWPALKSSKSKSKRILRRRACFGRVIRLR